MCRDTPLISVIIPLRNRMGVRLANCLRSLRWQDLEPAEAVEIVISDFGSDDAHRKGVAAGAAAFDAEVAHTVTDEVWNRSRALNIGIRKARGRYIFCTDVDMIFEPTFIRTLIEAQQRLNDAGFIVCGCRDMPETLAERAWQVEEFPAMKEQSPFREKLGTGACQMATRRFFCDVRGYDEGYLFWGMEDNDMRFRAKRSGLVETWVHDRTSMLHQWHPSSRGKRPFRKFLNDARFHLTKYRRVKNPGTWGKEP